MKKTGMLRRQNSEILEIIEKITPMLNAGSLSVDAPEVINLLTALSPKVITYLAIEDKILYPKIIDHRDTHLNETAGKIKYDFGGIRDDFRQYAGQWSSSASVASDPSKFKEETEEIFRRLSERIHKENNMLFPLVDKAEMIKRKEDYDLEENRLVARYEVNYLADAKVKEKTIETTIVNISELGVGVVLKNKVNVGEMFDISMRCGSLDGGDRNIKFKGKVVWVEENKDGTYRAGLEIVCIFEDDLTQLLEHIQELEKIDKELGQ